MRHLLIIFSLLLIFSCCRVAHELKLGKSAFAGNDFKLDGYYYSLENEGQLFFLYSDGVFIDFSCKILQFDNEELSERRDSTINYYASLGNYKNTQYGWGVWKVEDDNLIIEKWLSGSGGAYPVGRYVGNVINDTTINIAFTYQLPPNGKEKMGKFRFRQFCPKPDSTNAFIE